jgi:4-aminobutyrate aminotransferase-like enzyme
VLKVLQGGALENAGQMGIRLLEGLVALQRRFPAIGDVRGVGLMVAVELVDAQGAPDGHAAKQVIEACEQSGLLLLSCGPHKQCIRFMAPTTVTAAEIDQALVTFESSLATLPS